MGGQSFSFVFFIVSLIVCGAIVYTNWLWIRDRPADRSAIDNFAAQRGLRIISVTRSYNFFRYLLRGISVGNAVRFYVVAVEDSEGTRGDIRLAFDSLFSHGQVEMLEPEGLALAPSSGLASLTQSDSGTVRPSWNWCERLVLFGVGAGLSGFFFSGILHSYLCVPHRPVFPEPALGFTYLIKPKYGIVYGTYFEYLAVTYGVWTMWGFAVVCGLFGSVLDIQHKSRTYPRQIFAAGAISMVLYYAIWQASIYLARS
jgi:hypothetical protein